MHDAAFADAARQAPVTILRLPMLPYSIGHEIILLSQRNPLLFDDESFNVLPAPEQRRALMRAALTCYRTWNQNSRSERNLNLWGFLIRKTDWPTEIAAWRNYRRDGTTCPPSPTKEAYEAANGTANEEAGRAFGGSLLARLLVYVLPRYAALGFDTPYDFPLGLANHLYYSELEVAGNTRIENEREAQAREEIAAIMASVEEESKCQP